MTTDQEMKDSMTQIQETASRLRKKSGGKSNPEDKETIRKLMEAHRKKVAKHRESKALGELKDEGGE